MMKIVIASKNYSSWSLRAWLALEQTGAPYEESIISTADPDWHEQALRISPSGLLPVLVDEGRRINDSLAIVEYLHERFPEAGLWPSDPADRAMARSVVAEMHSGFMALRMRMPMDIQADEPGRGHTADALADAERIQEIWRECREQYGRSGPFMFGSFTAADCFYAPVVFRFRSYGVSVDANAKAYCEAMIEEKKVVKWAEAARREKRIYHG